MRNSKPVHTRDESVRVLAAGRGSRGHAQHEDARAGRRHRHQHSAPVVTTSLLWARIGGSVTKIEASGVKIGTTKARIGGFGANIRASWAKIGGCRVKIGG